MAQLELRRKEGKLSIGLGEEEFLLSDKDIDNLLVALIATKKDKINILKGKTFQYTILKEEVEK